MEPTDPYSDQSIEEQPQEQGSKLNISHVRSAQIEPQDAHWLRMDPSLTRAALAKTEEELLGSLAALMRNKVEHEQASRRFAQIQIDTEQAKHELATIKQQIRRAEEEVATRLNEQSRINEEILRVREELAKLREEDILAPLRAEVDERIKAREDLIAEAIILHQHVTDLASLKEQQATEISALGNSHAELRNKLEGLQAERDSLVSEIENLRQSVAQHGADKARLATGLTDLHNEIAEIAAERLRLQQSMADEQACVNDLLARKETLEQAVAEMADKRRDLHAEVTTLESRLRELTEAAEKAEQAPIAEDLPLLFGTESHKISPQWDPYPLESEFHTDEELNAKKVAELVSMLPGLEGCLIVKNHGPVLASEMPERIHAHLKVPSRNYQLLFQRLEKKIDEYNLQNARLATFDLGEEALTVAQANHAFVFVSHRQPKLCPGIPGKLASIVSEVAKMYP